MRRGLRQPRRDHCLHGSVAALDANQRDGPCKRSNIKVFCCCSTAVTLGFAWVLYPFYGAVLWAVVVAVLFAPVYRRLLQSMPGRPSLAAAVTVLIIIAMVILPLVMVAASLAQEASSLFAKIQSGEYNLGSYLQRIIDALPAWATGLIERFNLTDLSALREKLTSGLMTGGQILAPQALSIGMNTFDFVIRLGIMLYLLFFLLRDGKALAEGSGRPFRCAASRRRRCSPGSPTSFAPP